MRGMIIICLLAYKIAVGASISEHLTHINGILQDLTELVHYGLMKITCY